MTGGTPQSSERSYYEGGDINWVVSGDVHKKQIWVCEKKITKLGMENSNTRMLPKDSVLIALNGIGKTRGTVALLRVEATCNQSIVCISPKDGNQLSPEFLFHFLDGQYRAIRAITGDKDRRGLNMLLVRNIEIPVPPFAEQQRIVAILDEALAGLATAIANAENNLKNAQELFNSYLNSVVGIRSIGWVDKKLSEICEVKDGTHDSPKYVESGVPFVTQKNITKDGLSLSDVRFISETDHQNFYRRSNAAFGDILISMIGANRGMACAIDDPTIFSIKNVGLIKASPSINHEYLLYFLKSAAAQEYVRVASRGGAQEFVGLTKLRDFPIVVPPQRDQLAFVAALNELSEKVSQLRVTYRGKLDALNELKQSILQKAFSGELASTASQAAKEAAE